MEQKAAELVLEAEVKGLASYLSKPDYTNALNHAQRELTWHFPQTDDTRLYWLFERGKRPLFFMLLSETAHQFKYEQVNLQHRFEHYRSIIKDMDEIFREAVETEPALFAGVDTFRIFGTKIDAGFSYDEVGKDTTYGDKNIVIATPSEFE